MREPPAKGIPGLTGLRGIAALWVLSLHVQANAPAFGLGWLYDWPLLRNGWAGVDLFFMLSGFVLMYTHEADFHRITRKPLLDFAWLRFFRIYPLATVVLLLIALFVAIDPGFAVWYRQVDWPTDLTPVAFLKTLFLATRWVPPFRGDWNQPVWSLSVEIIGYCALPWLAWVLTRLSKPLPVLMIAAGCLAVPMIATFPFPGSFDGNDIYAGAFLRMGGGFAGGVALCRAWRLLPDFSPQRASIVAVASAAAIFALGCLPLRASLLFFPFAGLIFSLAYQQGAVSRALSSRLAMFLGQISFPLYLLHGMSLLWLRYFVESRHIAAPASIMMLTVMIVFILAASYALHRLVERPSHRWARQRVRRRSADNAAPVNHQAVEAA